MSFKPVKAIATALLTRAARRLSRIALYTFVITGSLTAWTAGAATGDLDPSFADHGHYLEAGAGSGAVRSVGPAGAGGVFFGGSRLSVRRMADECAIDATSFTNYLDAAGVVDSTFASASVSGIEGLDFARQADGRVVGVGRRVAGAALSGRCFLHVRTLAVFRLDPDGSLDAGFGTNGIFDWGAGALSSQHQGRAVLLQTDGAIVIAGALLSSDGGEGRLFVLRLLADGRTDPGFGTNGLFVGPRVNFHQEVSIARDRSGGYRVAGTSAEGCVIAGVTAKGSTATAFGGDGIAIIVAGGDHPVTCTALESRGDGRLLLAGSAQGRGFVTQLLASGAEDPTFVADAVIARSMTAATAIAPGKYGSTVVAGIERAGTSVIRLDATGTLDESFGDRGRTWIDLPSPNPPAPTLYPPVLHDLPAHTIFDLALETDGSLIAGGSAAFVVRLLGEAGGASAGIVSSLPAVVDSEESDGRAVVRVRRSGGGDGDVSVAYRTVADGNAVAGEDFTATQGTLHWANGDRSVRKIAVRLANNAGRPEGGEYFDVALDDVQGSAGLGKQTTRVNIQPDGAPGGQLQFQAVLDSRIHRTTGEDGDVQVWLGRNYYDAGRVCVTATTRPGTAVSGKDFTATTSAHCWEEGDSEPQVMLIPVLADDRDEANEYFTVVLSNPTGGAIVGAKRIAKVTIRANSD
jgi:uncharacterized delta-60 repeat protein